MENTQTLIRTRDEGREHTREMLIDDKVVCWLGVIDFTMRIGAGTARMAGIAGVETRHEHRKKGYMRILFADTVTYMQQQGYDVTMLYGIPDFYTKFGYAVCLSTPSLKLQTRDAELARSIAQPITTAPTTPADWPAIVDLFNQRNAARTCSMARAADTFKGFQKGSYWDVRAESVAIRDSHDRFAGYVVWDQNAEAVHVVELEVADEALYPALLAMLAQEAVKKRCGDITFHLPLDHPFGEFAQRYGCEWSVRHFRHANIKVRYIHKMSCPIVKDVHRSDGRGGDHAKKRVGRLGNRSGTGNQTGGAIVVRHSRIAGLRVAVNVSQIIFGPDRVHIPTGVGEEDMIGCGIVADGFQTTGVLIDEKTGCGSGDSVAECGRAPAERFRGGRGEGRKAGKVVKIVAWRKG